MNILIKIGVLLIALIISYLFGSVSWAIIISRVFYKQDVREFGSKNAGGTNIARTYGRKVGIIVILLDMAKMIVVYWLIVLLMKIPVIRDNSFVSLTVYSSALGVAIGHSYPIYYKFKGGKAVSVLAGFVVATSWWLTLLGLTLFLILLFRKRMVSLSSIIVSITLIILGPLFILKDFMAITTWPGVINDGIYYALVFVVLGVMLIYRHRENIVRIKNGTERLIGEKKNK